MGKKVTIRIEATEQVHYNQLHEIDEILWEEIKAAQDSGDEDELRNLIDDVIDRHDVFDAEDFEVDDITEEGDQYEDEDEVEDA
jgi:hypothetical protein